MLEQPPSSPSRRSLAGCLFEGSKSPARAISTRKIVAAHIFTAATSSIEIPTICIVGPLSSGPGSDLIGFLPLSVCAELFAQTGRGTLCREGGAPCSLPPLLLVIDLLCLLPWFCRSHGCYWSWCWCRCQYSRWFIR